MLLWGVGGIVLEVLMQRNCNDGCNSALNFVFQGNNFNRKISGTVIDCYYFVILSAC